MTVTGPSHIGIAVPDLEGAIALFKARLGVHPGEVMVNEAQGVRLVQFPFGALRIELLAPLGPDSPVAGFLLRHPKGGLHHLGVFAENLDETLEGLLDGKARLLGPPGINVFGRRMAFLHPGDLAGVLLEVEEI